MKIPELKSPSKTLREKNRKKVLQLYHEIKEKQPEASNNEIYKYIANNVGYSVSGVRKIIATEDTLDIFRAKADDVNPMRKHPHLISFRILQKDLVNHFLPLYFKHISMAEKNFLKDLPLLIMRRNG